MATTSTTSAITSTTISSHEEPNEEPAAKKACLEGPTLRVFLIPRRPEANVAFRRGDLVYARPKQRQEYSLQCFGTFDDSPALAQQDKEEKPPNESSPWIKFSHPERRQQTPSHRLFPVVKGTTSSSNAVTLVVVYDTSSFRQTAWSQLRQPVGGDPTTSTREHHVLEIGCSTGETSEIIWRQANSWIGFDTSASMIETVQQKLKTLPSHSDNASRAKTLYCERLDALVDPLKAQQVARRFHKNGPTDVFLDIGGNRSQEAVWRMLRFLCDRSAFPAIVQIIVKSEQVHKELCKELKIASSSRGGDGALSMLQLQVERTQEWLQEKLHQTSVADKESFVGGSLIQKLPKHPLKAPMRLSPLDGKTPICRFHNYHADGCARFRDEECNFDHTHCHFCLQAGHIARNCHAQKNVNGSGTSKEDG